MTYIGIINDWSGETIKVSKKINDELFDIDLLREIFEGGEYNYDAMADISNFLDVDTEHETLDEWQSVIEIELFKKGIFC